MMQHNPSPSPVWLAVDRQDFAALVGEFNGSLADLPDDDLPQRNEAWYCSMFQALLVGAGVPAHPRVANSRGATDLVVQLGRCLYYNFPNGCDYTQRVENGAIAHQIAL